MTLRHFCCCFGCSFPQGYWTQNLFICWIWSGDLCFNFAPFHVLFFSHAVILLLHLPLVLVWTCTYMWRSWSSAQKVLVWTCTYIWRSWSSARKTKVPRSCLHQQLNPHHWITHQHVSQLTCHGAPTISTFNSMCVCVRKRERKQSEFHNVNYFDITSFIY